MLSSDVMITSDVPLLTTFGVDKTLNMHRCSYWSSHPWFESYHFQNLCRILKQRALKTKVLLSKWPAPIWNRKRLGFYEAWRLPSVLWSKWPKMQISQPDLSKSFCCFKLKGWETFSRKWTHTSAPDGRWHERTNNCIRFISGSRLMSAQNIFVRLCNL